MPFPVWDLLSLWESNSICWECHIISPYYFSSRNSIPCCWGKLFSAACFCPCRLRLTCQEQVTVSLGLDSGRRLLQGSGPALLVLTCSCLSEATGTQLLFPHFTSRPVENSGSELGCLTLFPISHWEWRSPRSQSWKEPNSTVQRLTNCPPHISHKLAVSLIALQALSK